jgi:ligand-binding SRPBCC domain-containing protein
MQTQRLERISLIPRPRSEVFAFFSDARNLESITPPTLRFRITSSLPIEMCEGARIDYALRLFGVPIHWRTRITAWQPEERFIDEQERGPYALWRHLHEFEPLGSATRMRDVVDYALPLGPLGALAHGLWVKPTLERIFDYREKAVREHFAGVSGARSIVSSAE